VLNGALAKASIARTRNGAVVMRLAA